MFLKKSEIFDIFKLFSLLKKIEFVTHFFKTRTFWRHICLIGQVQGNEGLFNSIKVKTSGMFECRTFFDSFTNNFLCNSSLAIWSWTYSSFFFTELCLKTWTTVLMQAWKSTWLFGDFYISSRTAWAMARSISQRKVGLHAAA
jgi:hypothetical protein